MSGNEEYDPRMPNDFYQVNTFDDNEIISISKQVINRSIKKRKIKENANKTKKLTGEERAWKMLENMGWKGQGKKEFTTINIFEYRIG